LLAQHADHLKICGLLDKWILAWHEYYDNSPLG
jgi:hypothetical protein